MTAIDSRAPRRTFRALLGVGATLVALAAPLHAQTGPEGIARLDQLDELSTLFNYDAGNVRLVALLSPTCAYCVKGYRYMRRLLEEIEDDRLRMYVVWEPMLSADTEAIAARQARRNDDDRLVYQAWDDDRVTGEVWQDVMGHSGIAWDVYYLYGADVVWEDTPDAPSYWQHQLDGPAELRLDYDNLKREILALLERVQ